MVLVAGVDEAGRGALAGPVVSAAVILSNADPIDGLADSKTLSATQRECLFVQVVQRAVSYGIGIASHGIIERINVLQATLLSMKRAITRLHPRPDHVLVDGNKVPELHGYDIEAIVKGDQKFACISAASIIAKVIRDRIMCRNDRRFPGYYFARHKGYGTKAHIDQIFDQGMCSIHRKTFTIRRPERLRA